MNIDIYSEIKRAFKDALNEWNKQNKDNQFSSNLVVPQEPGNLLTIKQFLKKYPFISNGGIRSRLYSRKYNGLDKCVSQTGKKIFLKEKETLDWFTNPPKNAAWTFNEDTYKRSK